MQQYRTGGVTKVNKDMKSNLYTRTGDNGTTCLVGGQRVKKNCARLEAYGTLDELSSMLGAAVASGLTEELKGQLTSVQNELFNLGAYLATAAPEGTEPKCASLADGVKMKELEGWIDALDEQTPKINAFVLPGGCQKAAQLHLARVTCRREERRLLDLAEQEYVDPDVTAYINRLSDYLFIAARYANFMQGIDEVTWKQG